MNEERLPLLRTVGGRVAIAVALMVIAALALFGYNLDALDTLRTRAPDLAGSIDTLVWLQWVFAISSLATGGSFACLQPATTTRTRRQQYPQGALAVRCDDPDRAISARP